MAGVKRVVATPEELVMRDVPVILSGPPAPSTVGGNTNMTDASSTHTMATTTTSQTTGSTANAISTNDSKKVVLEKVIVHQSPSPTPTP